MHKSVFYFFTNKNIYYLLLLLLLLYCLTVEMRYLRAITRNVLMRYLILYSLSYILIHFIQKTPNLIQKPMKNKIIDILLQYFE